MHTRKTITQLLKQKRWTVKALAEHFECTEQAIRYHMKHIDGIQKERVRVIGEKNTYVTRAEFWVY